MIPLRTLRRQCLTAARPAQSLILSTRPFSASKPSLNAPSSDPGATRKKLHGIDPQWLTMTKRRIGRCMMFGLQPPQIQEAGEILQLIAKDWRELIAGSEGYLTDETRRGLFQQSVAWGEMDSMGHVNNVTYSRYAETARVYYTRNFALHIDPAHRKEWMKLVSSKGIGLIVRSIKLDYKFPMTYPDKVTVYHKLVHDPVSPEAPQHGFHLHAVILSEARQRPAARVYEDLVTYDYKMKKKIALPPFLLEQFKSTWELQEQAKSLWRRLIVDIETRVRALETGSWDREDAVEDTGSAKK
ncbi:Thioesterase/thiol ester dehydrase-isomerase [Aspergillus heteromorphus CBS 117.55]|uniref:Thioesterase/thiol ester dehydrase-isomerase n=1 Tax=Aspergillus heteromorphus CBS 117.55 TaxID=1448321 RepID=A0A317W232_9EURO|nr:Thioesterase/thiol ester dehydrase-isomerase [Aspergillus heteromorphus CBS 117.55]PWY80686.1 Thioesterase/thiol ester dehydrase-isomerase [Aspergillus heteromorphus CBS 117.55]